MMIENIIITTLLVLFVDALMNKFDVYKKFENFGVNSNSKFVYRLSKCEFCILFHLGWILFTLVILCNFLDISYLLTPFCVSGALKLIKK